MSPVHYATAGFVATALLGACMAQTPVTFNSKSFAGGPRPGNLYSLDLNKDGLPDVFQDTAETSLSSSGWSVILGSTPGNFRSPVFISSGFSGFAAQIPLAIADFNRNGIPDIAGAVPGTNSIEVLLGKGNGTFTRTFSHVNSPDNPFDEFPGDTAIAAADFNGDRNADLVAVMFDGFRAFELDVFSGNGTGGFSTPGTLIDQFTTGVRVHNIVVGDFNGDGHADIAFVNTIPCGSTSCSATLHVVYGDGKLGFRDATPYTAQGPLNISAGDLNSDGITDLFGVDAAAGQLAVFYGETGGAFATYFTNVPPGTFGGTSRGFSPQFAMADFNADWKMDLVGFERDSNAGTDNLVFFLSTGDPGVFPTQLQPLPSHLYTTNPVTADFNHDGKPDVVVNQGDGGSSRMLVLLNKTHTGIWSNCLYPPKGINVCSPFQTAVSPVAFSATAGSFGDIRTMELWIDGAKAEEQDYTWGTQAWFHSSASLANGTHSIAFFSADIDNRKQKVKFSLNVGPPACSAPASPGIIVCAPNEGATIGRPIAVQASATLDGSFVRMEIWVDGMKEYTQTTTPYLDARVPAPPVRTGSTSSPSTRSAPFGTRW